MKNFSHQNISSIVYFCFLQLPLPVTGAIVFRKSIYLYILGFFHPSSHVNTDENGYIESLFYFVLILSMRLVCQIIHYWLELKKRFKIVKARILLTCRSFLWYCLVLKVFGLVLQIEIISQTLKRSLQKKLWEKLTSKIQNLKFTISFKTSTWLQESRYVEDIRLEYDLWQNYVVYAGVNNALLQTSFF